VVLLSGEAGIGKSRARAAWQPPPPCHRAMKPVKASP
jgi:hypothetical protein